MANDIDELMNIDPTDLTQENIDDIIAYHRQNRLNLEAGIKSAKPKKEAGPKVSIAGLLDKIKATPPKGDALPAVTKPASSGLRKL